MCAYFLLPYWNIMNFNQVTENYDYMYLSYLLGLLHNLFFYSFVGQPFSKQLLIVSFVLWLIIQFNLLIVLVPSYPPIYYFNLQDASFERKKKKKDQARLRHIFSKFLHYRYIEWQHKYYIVIKLFILTLKSKLMHKEMKFVLVSKLLKYM